MVLPFMYTMPYRSRLTYLYGTVYRKARA